MELLTLTEVANILKVNRLTAWRYVKDGKLKGYKVGTQYRIYADELERFIKGGAVE